MSLGTTRAETLAREIADAILAGELAPGARLDEQGLAQRYSVSRTPVREALRQLGASGLIETRPRRGVVVATVTPDQLGVLFVAMAEIEATCARLCALRMTSLERRQLGALHGRMGELMTQDDRDAYADANVAFHAAIEAGAHNAVFSEISSGLRRRLSPYRRAQFRAPGRLRLSHSEHGDVVEPILRGDAVAAHAAMLHHVTLVEDAFEQLTSARGVSSPSAAP